MGGGSSKFSEWSEMKNYDDERRTRKNKSPGQTEMERNGMMEEFLHFYYDNSINVPVCVDKDFRFCH